MTIVYQIQIRSAVPEDAPEIARIWPDGRRVSESSRHSEANVGMAARHETTPSAGSDIASLEIPVPQSRPEPISFAPAVGRKERFSLSGGHLRRILIVALSALSRTWIPFAVIGALNRVFPTFVSVFFCYAGNTQYASHYSYPSYRRFLLWFPSTIGVFRQGKRWGLICAAPVTEAEFTDPKNALDLSRLLRRMLRIKMLLGVNQLSFAGVLPNVLRGRYFQTPSNMDRDRTPEVVRRAFHVVRQKHFADRRHTVVLLGGAGRVGRRVHQLLMEDGIESVIIDPAALNEPAFKALGHVSMMLVDVSRYGVLDSYIQELPEGTVVLNEVFPEPSRDVVKQLKNRNITAYHIAGVKADVYPSLPHAYRNAVPCCAIHSDEIGDVVLTRIA